MAGFEPTTPGSRNRCATKLRYIPLTSVSSGGLEPPTSALSGRRSDRLSYDDEAESERFELSVKVVTPTTD